MPEGSTTRTAAPQSHDLDLRGLKCPLPALRTRKALGRIAPGDVLIVACTDPLAAIDIPHLVREGGHVLLGQDHNGSALTFRIRRGEV